MHHWLRGIDAPNSMNPRTPKCHVHTKHLNFSDKYAQSLKHKVSGKADFKPGTRTSSRSMQMSKLHILLFSKSTA